MGRTDVCTVLLKTWRRRDPSRHAVWHAAWQVTPNYSSTAAPLQPRTQETKYLTHRFKVIPLFLLLYGVPPGTGGPFIVW